MTLIGDGLLLGMVFVALVAARRAVAHARAERVAIGRLIYSVESFALTIAAMLLLVSVYQHLFSGAR